jgi:hypothetical protein
MLRVVQRTAVIVLAAFFLGASAGISLFVHTCGSSHRTDYRLFPEYFSTGDACCGLTNDTHIGGCSSHSHAIPEGISRNSCCEKGHVLLKVSVFNGQTVTKVKPITAFVDLVAEPAPSELNRPSLDTKDLTGLYHAPPPLMTGKSLVFYLNQIRIPS